MLIPHLRRGLLDHPNARSCHHEPTPRGGGSAFVAVACFFSLLSFFNGIGSAITALPLIAAPLAIIGLYDDRYNLPASWRYGMQLVTAFFILGISPLVQRLMFDSLYSIFLILVCALILVVSVTAIINFINFMDGIDGLVAGCLSVIIFVLAIPFGLPLTLCVLVGSLLGFLFWNWSPAKIFMGDVGSTFLGAVFAGLVLQSPTWSDSLASLLIATPILADACVCVIRRLLAGQRVFQPHRLHLFQRLYQAGWSHARVAVSYIIATLVLAIALLTGGVAWVFCLAIAELLIGFALDQRVAFPFADSCDS